MELASSIKSDSNVQLVEWPELLASSLRDRVWTVDGKVLSRSRGPVQFAGLTGLPFWLNFFVPIWEKGDGYMPVRLYTVIITAQVAQWFRSL